MFSRIRTALLLAIVASPAGLNAQQQTEPSQEVQEWLSEMQQIQQQLQPVQQQALQDEAIQQEQQRATEAVRAAMLQKDPEMGTKLERLEAIMQEAQQAQAAGDSEKIVALTQEAQQLQPQLAEAQAEAMAQPEVQSQVTSFQQQLRSKMAELDPDAQPLLDRLAKLEEQIQNAMRQGQSS
jgi:hypothetical protein